MQKGSKIILSFPIVFLLGHFREILLKMMLDEKYIENKKIFILQKAFVGLFLFCILGL